jgi:hypothetical protein
VSKTTVRSLAASISALAVLAGMWLHKDYPIYIGVGVLAALAIAMFVVALGKARG